MKTLKLPHKPMILSISGGVDSMVLLSLVTHPDSVVVHFNHGLRPSASADATFVQQAALRNNLRFELVNLILTADENMQDQARTMRYQHLVEIAKKYQIHEVALGHQADDVVESMLHHLLRGSSLKGLQMRSSFTIDGVRFSRPLLAFTKQALLDYVKDNNIQYVEDDSNNSDKYLRNRLRHHVIPLLAAEQPQLVEKFAQLSQQVQDLIPLLDELTDDVFTAPSRSTYQRLLPVLQKHVLTRWLDVYRISPHQALLEQMDDVLRSTTPHQEVSLSKEVQLQTSYDTVRFVTNVTNLDFMQKINAPGTYEGPNHDIVIVTTDPSHHDENIVSIDLSTADIFPLELRYRKPGDVVYLSGGRKKLKDWLIDLKMDQQERNQLLVLAKDRDVLWIPALSYQSSKKGHVKIYCSWRPQQ
jgi:tRNA(Ile)-lysidine synthase